MANFKALSSRFAFGTVLLLLVINNMYPATATATAAACSSSSKVMLFNSSSLEVVEEFAKGQETTTEIDADHEIRRRILQGRGGAAWNLVKNSYDVLTNAIKPTYKFVGKIKKAKDVYDFMDGYCKTSCYTSNAYTMECTCVPYGQAVTNQPTDYCMIYANFYCCTGENEVCSLCCYGNGEDSTATRTGIILPPGITSSSSSSSSLSSSESPIAYVVIAICSIQSMLLF